MSNAQFATIATLSNGGTIRGGNGGNSAAAPAAAGGAGVSNSGTITTLTNGGAISGGRRQPQVRRAGRRGCVER